MSFVAPLVAAVGSSVGGLSGLASTLSTVGSIVSSVSGLFGGGGNKVSSPAPYTPVAIDSAPAAPDAATLSSGDTQDNAKADYLRRARLLATKTNSTTTTAIGSSSGDAKTTTNTLLGS